MLRGWRHETCRCIGVGTCVHSHTRSGRKKDSYAGCERTFYQWMEHHVECALSLSVGEVRLERVHMNECHEQWSDVRNE